MKILIRKDRVNGYWKLRIKTNGKEFNSWFVSFEGASEEAKKRWKRYYKECAAYAMVSNISVNLLSALEADFIQELKKRKCSNITKAQYGYLKGIHERQEREW